MATNLRILKLEGRVVPLLSELGSPFRYGLLPSELVENIEVRVEGQTEDIELVKSLFSEPITAIYDVAVSQSIPPERTVYLEIQRYEYRRPQMDYYRGGEMFKPGLLDIYGKLLSHEPEQIASLTDYVRWLNLSKVRHVDYDSLDGLGHERPE